MLNLNVVMLRLHQNSAEKFPRWLSCFPYATSGNGRYGVLLGRSKQFTGRERREIISFPHHSSPGFPLFSVGFPTRKSGFVFFLTRGNFPLTKQHLIKTIDVRFSATPFRQSA